jgi:FAD-dependent urate hydroxylase
MTSTRRALVIGGGIAGPVTAMALEKAGFEAVVYEAQPASADRTGAFLTLASNGIDALRVLGADERVLAAGFPTPAITLRSGTGKRLGTVRTGRSADDGTESRTLRRADLQRALHEEALARGIAVEHGRRLVDADDTGDGVRARFADGSEATGDVLVGCDGVHSAVRALVDPAAPAPAYAGLIGTGGYATGVAVDAAPGTYEMIFGRRAFFGYVVDPGGGTVWFANVPRPAVTAAERAATPAEQWQRQLVELFADDQGPASSLVADGFLELAGDSTHDLPSVPTWHRGPMVIVGDAAHAPSPTSGQGASMAAEDAVVLAQCLRDRPDIPQALAAYEGLRRRRVERIVAQGARTGSAKTPGPVGRVLRDLALPLVFKLLVTERSMAWIYDHHIDWDTPVAVPAQRA